MGIDRYPGIVTNCYGTASRADIQCDEGVIIINELEHKIQRTIERINAQHQQEGGSGPMEDLRVLFGCAPHVTSEAEFIQRMDAYNQQNSLYGSEMQKLLDDTEKLAEMFDGAARLIRAQRGSLVRFTQQHAQPMMADQLRVAGSP